MPHNEQNIDQYHAGDALDIVCTVENDNGTTIDITNANDIRWLLKESSTDIDTDALLDKNLSGGGIEITDGVAGEFVVHIETDDTSGMTGQKHHRARLTDSNGDRSTVFHGTFTISE